jgi:hypothetical protein
LAEARAAVEERGTVEAREDWPRLPEVGELRIAEPTRPGEVAPRLVLVTATDPHLGVAEVALTSNEVEFATDVDITIAAGNSHLPFDLMVETDVVGRLWFNQLARLVASLDPEMTETACRAVLDGPGAVPVGLRGLPISGPNDRRLEFKREEGAALDALALDCSDAEARGRLEPTLMLDPVLFLPREDEPEQIILERLLEIAEQLTESPAAGVPVQALERQLAGMGFDSHTWTERQGHDAYQALMQLFERALCEAAALAEGELTLRPSRESWAEDADQELQSMMAPLFPSGARSVRLLTSNEAWVGGVPGGMAMARAEGPEGFGPLQIVRQELEAIP